MRSRLLIILFLLSATNVVHAQQAGNDSLYTSRFRPGLMWFYTGFRPANPGKLRKYDRLIIDLTYNTWTGDRKLFSNHWGSLGVNASLMFDIPLVKNNLFSFGTGITYSFVRIRHDASLVRDTLGSFSSLNNLEENALPGKRMLTGSMLSIPFELRFRTPGWKHVKIHFGGRIGYQFPWRSKIVTNPQTARKVDKSHPYPDVNHLSYSLHSRLGIRNWACYVSYNLNTLFKASESAQLNIFQVGLSLSLF